MLSYYYKGILFKTPCKNPPFLFESVFTNFATILFSLQLARPARGIVKEEAVPNGNYPYFEHYYVQVGLPFSG